MEPTRLLAALLSLSRVAFGATFVLDPRAAEPSWIGRAARRPGTQVLARSQGARDVALGAGALWALGRHADREARTWMAAHLVADGTDLAATLLARDRLPSRRARLAAGLAAGSAAIAALSTVRLGSG